MVTLLVGETSRGSPLDEIVLESGVLGRGGLFEGDVFSSVVSIAVAMLRADVPSLSKFSDVVSSLGRLCSCSGSSESSNDVLRLLPTCSCGETAILKEWHCTNPHGMFTVLDRSYVCMCVCTMLLIANMEIRTAQSDD